MGGAGGGAIRLVVSGSLTNNGAITANGGFGNICSGGGSGGSVYVTTGTLAGAGIFAANGGATPNCTNGGGGGRIAVYYNSAGSFTGFTTSTATGGDHANNGTVVFVDASQTNQKLYIYQQYTLPAGSISNFDSITISNAGSLTMGAAAQVVNLTGSLALSNASSASSQSSNTGARSVASNRAGRGRRHQCRHGAD